MAADWYWNLSVSIGVLAGAATFVWTWRLFGKSEFMGGARLGWIPAGSAGVFVGVMAISFWSALIFVGLLAGCTSLLARPAKGGRARTSTRTGPCNIL